MGTAAAVREDVRGDVREDVREEREHREDLEPNREPSEGLEEKTWWQRYEEPDKALRDFTAHEVGVQGEFLACRYLSQRGYEVVEQNWRAKRGEVDIIAVDGDGTTVLIEVKTRLNLDGDPQSMPELAVDGDKQRTYRHLALLYLMEHPSIESIRFDVIAINIVDDHNAKLRHLVGCFCWDDR